MTTFSLALLSVLASTGCAAWRVDKAAQVATGFGSHLLCNDVFVTGVAPDTAFAERVQSLPGMGLVNWGLRYQLDADRREVRVSVAGAFESRARYRDGLGCLAGPTAQMPAEDAPLPSQQPVQPHPAPDPAGSEPVTPASPQLRAALLQALVDAPGAPAHRTKAVVVLQDGRLIGEAYRPGYGPDTPVLGFSVSKSITSSLIGILVHQGRLRLDQPAPLPQWADPRDPRHAITVEQLLRQTSGLDLLQTNSGFDITSQIMYSSSDKAGASAAATLARPPGTHWAYTDGNYMLLSRIVRDAVGGSAADVQGFARSELFAPLGMHHAQMDFDATGTPVGSSHVMASARDFARLGQLYLDDGKVAGRRILPPGWVQQVSTPTLATGYGAGWWTNRASGLVPGWGVPWGLPSAPPDTFFARGFMGQFVVVVPSRRLVIVRLSVSAVRGDDIEETDRLVGRVLSALPGPGWVSGTSGRVIGSDRPRP